MGLFDFLLDTFVGGICPWGPNGAFPIIKKHVEEEPSSEEEKKPNYELLRLATPIKLHEDEAREVWLGKAHESPTHSLHHSGSTEPWQIDIIGTYKKPEKKKEKTFYKLGIGIDDWSKGSDDVRLFVPLVTSPPEEPDEEYEQLKKDLIEHSKKESEKYREETLRIITENLLASIYKPPKDESDQHYAQPDSDSSSSTTPSMKFISPSDYSKIHLVHQSTYEPPEDNRNLDQKIYDFTDPMARKCVSFVDLMAQQRHEALQDAIQDAPSGYQLWTPPTPPQDSSSWTCTPNMPKYNLEAPRPMPNGCRPIPPSAFPSF